MAKSQILVPIDFSPQSKAALGYAEAFAQQSGAELLVVHVIDSKIQDLKGLKPEDSSVALYEVLHALKPADENIACSYQIIEGRAAKSIVDLANEEGVDMIVMGTHGRTGMKRLVMGSVAEAVVRNAQCPVLTLRDPAAKPESETTTT
jgi:nucleotide-binding universal stress UspA family protein